jgi:hypothetical protein
MNNEPINDDMKELLKRAVAPVQDAELPRDLWPQMLRKLDEQPSPLRSIPWLDWALVAIVSAVLIFFPGSIPALLYHL